MKIKEVVANEAFLWGNDVADSYHGAASSHMDEQWKDMIAPILSKYPIDYSTSIDFAAGFGRNTVKLLENGGKNVIAIDINPDCISHLTAKFRKMPVKIITNNGVDIQKVKNSSATFFYTFDAMVHFDFEIVLGYIKEAFRVLKINSYAFIHHSNYSQNPGGDFTKNPHWRNFMSSSLFKHMAIKSGFEVVEQIIFAWGEPDIDCITILRKP